MGEDTAEKCAEPKKLEGPVSLKVLEEIKTSQQRNGLLHGDYRRYRQYCARRLRRIRVNKDVDFKLGKHRGPYEHRIVTAEVVTNPLFLYLPLINAERAWAYAMELKDEDRQEEAPRKRLHLIRRLNKAVKWASQFKELCAAVADDRTSLEADAYAAWMAGNMYLEKDQWKEAYMEFEKAKSVYEQLSSVGSPDTQEIMKTRVEDEIVPFMRYCQFYYSREDPGTAEEALKSLKKHGGMANDVIDAKIRKVLEQARKEQSSQVTTLKWLGEEIPLRSESAKVKLLEVRDQRNELLKQLDEASSQIESNEVEEELERTFLESLSTFDDAASSLRLEHAKAIKGAVTVDKINKEYNAILDYIKSVKLYVIIKRKLANARSVEAKFKPDSSTVPPQDLYLLYDRLYETAQDLCEIMGEEKHEASSEKDVSQQDAKAYELLTKSLRSYFIAWIYAGEMKWAEAVALFEHNLRGLSDGIADLECSEGLKQELLETEKKFKGAQSFTLAKSFISKLPATETPIASSTEGPEGPTLQLCPLPPPIEPVPCHPIVFDLAYANLSVGEVANQKATSSKPSSSSKKDQQHDQQQQQESGWLSSARGWFSRR